MRAEGMRAGRARSPATVARRFGLRQISQFDERRAVRAQFRPVRSNSDSNRRYDDAIERQNVGNFSRNDVVDGKGDIVDAVDAEDDDNKVVQSTTIRQSPKNGRVRWD